MSQAGNINYYDASSVLIPIKVAKASQTITVDRLQFDVEYENQPFNLYASASSGLGLTYLSADTSIASVDTSGNVTIQGVGTTTITVTQGGNSNYVAGVTVKVVFADASV